MSLVFAVIVCVIAWFVVGFLCWLLQIHEEKPHKNHLESLKKKLSIHADRDTEDFDKLLNEIIEAGMAVKFGNKKQ